MIMFQKTIKKEITFSGKGLHSGLNSIVKLIPSKPDTGITFFLNNHKIKLSLDNIFDTHRSMVLGTKTYHVMTIEHLIASLYMMGITNLFIELNNKEIPALDGSALSFIKIIKKAGIKNQNKKIKPLMIQKPILCIDKGKFIIGLPSNKFKISYHIDFDHPLLKNRLIHFKEINEKIFINQIAPARTFGFESEVKDLLKKGLAQGGDLNNAVVLSKNSYLNKKLRFKDECIRHKVVDFIGALAFLQRPVLGHFIVSRSGHYFDLKFIKQLMDLK